MRNQRLFAALLYFPLDGGFLERLCRENNWPHVFGRRAIEEYKRFVYLAMVAPTPVTPSGDVDRVWRLHLLHERSYQAMSRLLPRPLPYKPLAGGDWYQRTKSLYAAEFGHAPPSRLWLDQPVASDHLVDGTLPKVLGAFAGLAVGIAAGLLLPLPEGLIGWLPILALAVLTGNAVVGLAGGERPIRSRSGDYTPPTVFYCD